MKKKLAIDNTNCLLEELEFFTKSSNSLEIISRVTIRSIFDEFLFGEKIRLFTEVPSLQFLIDLCLRNSEPSKRIPDDDDLIQIMYLLEHYFENLQSSDIRSNNETSDDIDLIFLIHHIQFQSMLLSINRERYLHQQKDHIEGIHFRLNHQFDKIFGFTVTDAMTFSLALSDEFGERIKQEQNKITKIAKTFDGKNTINSSKVTTDELLKHVKSIFANSKDLFIFSVPEICTKHFLSVVKFKKFLNSFSCKFGDASINDKIPFGEFLINYKPIVRLTENKVFCPLPHYNFWVFHLVIEQIVKDNEIKKLTSKLKDIKSEYMEQKISSFLSRLFPSAKIHKNLYYYFENKRREIDVLVEFDNKILIFEAKSNSLTPPAKFGLKPRLKTDLQKIIEDAFTQSTNAKKYLISTNEAQFENKKGIRILTIRDSNKQKIYQINVTLEPLGNISTILGRLKKIGLFIDGEYPWSVYLYDLDDITHILSHPSIFIHYIEQRMIAQHDEVFRSMEEKQLFYWYLLFVNLRPFGTGRSDNSLYLSISGMDCYDAFDNYFIYSGPKPTLRLNKKEIKKIIKLEKSQKYGFTDEISEFLDTRHPYIWNT